MAETKFKVGDRVRCISDSYKELKGKEGIIKFIDNIDPIFAIEFFDYTNGHDCYGHCKLHQGKWLDASDIEKTNYNNNKIIIFQQGNTVCVKLLENKVCINVAEAKCSPKDNFDILVGAQIALQRLVDKQGSKHVINLNAFNDSIELIK